MFPMHLANSAIGRRNSPRTNKTTRNTHDIFTYINSRNLTRQAALDVLTLHKVERLMSSTTRSHYTKTCYAKLSMESIHRKTVKLNTVECLGNVHKN